jgi:hypothetical protein
MTLLNDGEWSKWSNEAIARTCCVSPHTVADVKKSISANAEMPAVRIVERNGKTYEQNTANIGKGRRAFDGSERGPSIFVGRAVLFWNCPQVERNGNGRRSG